MQSLPCTGVFCRIDSESECFHWRAMSDNWDSIEEKMLVEFCWKSCDGRIHAKRVSRKHWIVADEIKWMRCEIIRLFTDREALISCERMASRRTAKATIPVYTFEINHSKVQLVENYKHKYVSTDYLFFLPTINSQITTTQRSCSAFDWQFRILFDLERR